MTAPPRLAKTTILARVMWTIVLVSTAALVVAGAVVWALASRSATVSLDDRLVLLRAELQLMASERTDPATGTTLATPSEVVAAKMRSTAVGEGEGHVGLLDGRIHWVASGVGGLHPETDADLTARIQTFAAEPESRLETVQSPKGRFRVLVVPITDGTDRAAYAHVLDIDYSEAGLHRLMRLYAAAAAVTVVLVATLAWFGVGRLLRPIAELRHATEAIDENDLTTRVKVRGRNDLSALATTFNRMLDRVQASVESQRRLLDDVGHELRTPITVVRGHLELTDPNDPNEVRETRDLTIEELDRMGGLIEDMIELARTGRPEYLSPEPTDVAALTRQVFVKAQALGQRDWRLGEVAAATAVLDPRRITQAWLQLADNAIKYSDVGSQVTLSSWLDGDDVVLAIVDHGIGISPEDIERVRARFSRADAAASRASGSGLGLNIVDGIVAAHGGRLGIESALGVGSRFTMWLPLGRARQGGHS